MSNKHVISRKPEFIGGMLDVIELEMVEIDLGGLVRSVSMSGILDGDGEFVPVCVIISAILTNARLKGL